MLDNSAFVHESVRFRGEELVIWAGIYINGRTVIYIIPIGVLNGAAI